MKTQEYTVQRFDADEGKVFDWVDLEAHQYKNEKDEIIQEHLYAKTLFLSDSDNIENYVEVEKPVEE